MHHRGGKGGGKNVVFPDIPTQACPVLDTGSGSMGGKRGMIKHIVMWTLKDFAESANKKEKEIKNDRFFV
jgi:hypothetical protein